MLSIQQSQWVRGPGGRRQRVRRQVQKQAFLLFFIPYSIKGLRVKSNIWHRQLRRSSVLVRQSKTGETFRLCSSGLTQWQSEDFKLRREKLSHKAPQTNSYYSGSDEFTVFFVIFFSTSSKFCPQNIKNLLLSYVKCLKSKLNHLFYKLVASKSQLNEGVLEGESQTWTVTDKSCSYIFTIKKLEQEI